MTELFDGFDMRMIETEEATLRVRVEGSGPSLLLLNGLPLSASDRGRLRYNSRQETPHRIGLAGGISVTATSTLPTELTDHFDDVRRLCVRYHIQALYVFGSAVTGTFDPDTSDIDFMVDLGVYGDDVAVRYFDLLWALEALFERQVDLITVRSRGDAAFLAEVEATRVAVYAA